MHITESLVFLHPKYFFAIWLLQLSFKKMQVLIPGIYTA